MNDELLETMFNGRLEEITYNKFLLQTDHINYHLSGELSSNPTLLEMQFKIEFNKGDSEPITARIDLNDNASIEKSIFEWTDKSDANYKKCLQDINFIKQELERIRRERQNDQPKQKVYTSKQAKQAKELLNGDNIMDELNKLIGQSGIVGQEKLRLLLFIIASSYKFRYNLHGVIQTDDVQLGRDLVENIMNLIPELDRHLIDSNTTKSFRHYGVSSLHGKMLCITDYRAIILSKSVRDLKKLQANDWLLNDAPKKDVHGELKTVQSLVWARNSSIGAISEAKKYFEAEPKTMILGMDTSAEQVDRLIERDCKEAAGLIDDDKEEEAWHVLWYVLEKLNSHGVVNPFAGDIVLPLNIPNRRNLTNQLHKLVSLIALFHQYRREKDEDGNIIAEKEDVKIAVELFVDTVDHSIDELDPTLRKFFDSLKELMLKKKWKEKTRLSRVQIMKALGGTKATLNRKLVNLLDYEYVQRFGYKNKGFTYRVANWDDNKKLKQTLLNQLATSSDS